MKLILKLVFTALAVILISRLVPGVHLDTFSTAILVAIILAILNATLKPLLIILTIPITVITLGIFLLVINAIIISLTDYLIPGFRIDGFMLTLLFSLILSLMTTIFESFGNDDR